MINIHSEKSRGRKSNNTTVKNIIVLCLTAVIIWSEVLLQTSSDVQMN